jgi:diphthamide synthase (EF-2-diphthine--ammonia ligase)
MTALFPIWKRDSRELVESFHAQGFRSIAVCVNSKLLDRSFAGRELDASFLADLPPEVDCCGENGEFHTFAFDGPIFKEPVRFQVGECVERDSFIFCDLLMEKECQAYESASNKA